MDNINGDILKSLFALQDLGYQVFLSKLTPSLDPRSIIGVRTPALRKLAKEVEKREDVGVFLSTLPHRYFEENQLHAFIISNVKDYHHTICSVNEFLPYVDNWATCDQMSPRVFRTHHAELLEEIDRWIASKHLYTVRFGVGMLMQHYLDEDFDVVYPERVAALRSEEYYVNMMIAWYFATALAKQYDAALPFLERHRLTTWTHNKAIQKAIESFRVTEEQKKHLRTLKIKK